MMSGKPMDPDDRREYIDQVTAEPDLYTMICKANPPKVTIKNDIFPRPHEVYNCTSCTRGRELPANKLSKEDYHFYCKWDLKTHIGLEYSDNGCPKWNRKVKIPKHGFMPGVESGPYDKRDRI